MIIDELVLHNFGAYHGRQAFDLTPPSEQKPVTLIGGMNGGGKTTFLDAIQLVLYGKRADCSNRNGQAYDEYLEDCIHNNAPQTEGAAIELAFRHHSEGEEQAYRVERSWYPTEKSISESVEVTKNDSLDEVVTDNWDEYVEEFIPFGISQLFLFDGEKIKRFADLENSSELLESAIHTLLGLDIVEQLSTDLVALRRRKQAEMKEDEDKEKIEEAKAKVQRLEDNLDQLSQQRGEAQKNLDRLRQKLEEVEEKYRLQGGELYDQRKELEAERRQKQRELDEVKDELRSLAADAAPLVMVSDLLEEISDQDAREQKATRAEILSETLEERDRDLLDEAGDELGLESDKLDALQTLLDRDRKERTEGKSYEQYLELHDDARHQLDVLLKRDLDASVDDVEATLSQSQEISEEIVTIDRQLAAVPDEEAIAALIEEREDLLSEVNKKEAKVQTLDEQLEELELKYQEAKADVVRLIEKQVELDFENEAANRIVEHSDRVQSTISEFRDKVVRQHVDRIESLVLESFRKLLRKKSLVDEIDIDPSTFEVHLYDQQGRELPPSRFSAGERQIMAVSLLWGLARASGRPLPTVVDTPLGRLDSSHREHLVERYFPNASHQVILLSTDEEIDGHYYESLEPHVGHEYLLDYDDETNATEVKEGYFEEMTRNVA